MRSLSPRQVLMGHHSFLTQTRPTTDESPVRFRSPIKTQVTPGWKLSTTTSPRSVFPSLRKPLAPILSQDPDEDDVPARKRLHKRAVSTSPERAPVPAQKLRSAFDVLGKRTSPKRKRPVRSDYVEAEAEESDDEAAFDFGAKRWMTTNRSTGTTRFGIWRTWLTTRIWTLRQSQRLSSWRKSGGWYAVAL